MGLRVIRWVGDDRGAYVFGNDCAQRMTIKVAQGKDEVSENEGGSRRFFNPNLEVVMINL